MVLTLSDENSVPEYDLPENFKFATVFSGKFWNSNRVHDKIFVLHPSEQIY